METSKCVHSVLGVCLVAHTAGSVSAFSSLSLFIYLFLSLGRRSRPNIAKHATDTTAAWTWTYSRSLINFCDTRGGGHGRLYDAHKKKRRSKFKESRIDGQQQIQKWYKHALFKAAICKCVCACMCVIYSKIKQCSIITSKNQKTTTNTNVVLNKL